MVDGSDYAICKVNNNTLQSLTWSVKNHTNTIRFLFYGLLNGMPIIALPLNGMTSTGKSNDMNTIDFFHCHNEGILYFIFEYYNNF